MSKKRTTFGLIGKSLSHSFSKNYFTAKFAENHIDCEYLNFELDEISGLKDLVGSNPDLGGLNVTIPYKQTVIPYLDELSGHVESIGAVNTIEITARKLIGHNTDWIGFRDSILPLLKPQHRHALILGTGGASKAVAFALQTMGIPYDFVSRNTSGVLNYDDMEPLISARTLVINTTPLGTWPDIDHFPSIPYHLLTPEHLAYDLIYNPPMSAFLTRAAKYGAITKNGAEMLTLQAEASWQIWQR